MPRASGTSVSAKSCADAHLRDLAQEDVAGVDVDDQRRAGERAHRGVGDALRQQARRRAPGKLRFRSASKTGTKRSSVSRPSGFSAGIELDAAAQRLGPRLRELFEPGREPVADVEPLELVAVDAGDHRDARARRRREDRAVAARAARDTAARARRSVSSADRSLRRALTARRAAPRTDDLWRRARLVVALEGAAQRRGVARVAADRDRHVAVVRRPARRWRRSRASRRPGSSTSAQACVACSACAVLGHGAGSR